jgi:hypothetical protein
VYLYRFLEDIYKPTFSYLSIQQDDFHNIQQDDFHNWELSGVFYNYLILLHHEACKRLHEFS